MHITSRRIASVLAAASLAITAAACGESSTAPGGEQELISRVTLTLTPQAGGAPLTAYIDDPDGNGPQSPTAQVGTLALQAGATYTGTILFENRLETPPENITEEVEEEADEHRVYYTVSGAGVTVTTLDTDSQGRPLGLSYRVVAGATAGTGQLRVVLCHYDDAPKVGSSTSCQGDTDIDVIFGYTIAN